MNFEDFKTLLPHKKVFKKFLLPENLPHPDTLESKMVKEDQTLDGPPYIVKVDKKYVKYGGIWVSYDSMLLDQLAIKKAKDSGAKWPQYQGVPFTDNELAQLLYNDNTVVLARNTNQQLQFNQQLQLKNSGGRRRRTRKKRGKGGVMSAMRNKEARKQQRKKVLIKAQKAFLLLYDKARKEAIQKAKTKINPIINNKKYSLQDRKDRMLKILEKHPNLKLMMGKNGLEVKFQPPKEELRKMIAIARANVFNPNEDYYPYPKSQLEETTKLFKPTDPIKEFPYAPANKSGGKRTRRRKSKRKKRRTRRAGMLQSKTPGQKGLTEREIKLRKKARLKALVKANEKLKARIVSDRDIAKSFENLRVSPVQTKDEILSSMKSFQERMSPISFSKKTTNGGKKTRKKRRRKRRR
tara:strand:- start:2008 stop:3234 length:1227 start_codon:yes stop_codon:yes gene_type:complete